MINDPNISDLIVSHDIDLFIEKIRKNKYYKKEIYSFQVKSIYYRSYDILYFLLEEYPDITLYREDNSLFKYVIESGNQDIFEKLIKVTYDYKTFPKVCWENVDFKYYAEKLTRQQTFRIPLTLIKILLSSNINVNNILERFINEYEYPPDVINNLCIYISRDYSTYEIITPIFLRLKNIGGVSNSHLNMCINFILYNKDVEFIDRLKPLLTYSKSDIVELIRQITIADNTIAHLNVALRHIDVYMINEIICEILTINNTSQRVQFIKVILSLDKVNLMAIKENNYIPSYYNDIIDDIIIMNRQTNIDKILNKI